ILLLETGTYSGFTLDGKWLTVIADGTAAAQITGPIVVRNLAADQSATFRGLHVHASGATQGAMVFEANAGPAWVEECELVPDSVGAASVPAASVTSCLTVAFQRCTLTGAAGHGTNAPAAGGHGLVVSDSLASLGDTVCKGGSGDDAQGSFAAQPGGAGASTSGGFFYASGSTFQGGTGGHDSAVAGPHGGPGLHAGGQVSLLHCEAMGGTGGGTMAGPRGFVGAPIEGTFWVTQLTGPKLSFKARSPVRIGGLSTFFFQGQPDQFVAVMLAPNQGPSAFVSFLEGPVLLDFNNTWEIKQGAILATGDLVTFPAVVDSLPTFMQGTTVYVQPIFLTIPTLDFSIGPASALTILDANL
ncbi:MAG TPA: hypothetical protein VKE69_00175, partial [Planctomycetota bacterium]|nr:hypothetical protein [Planctomycetota bacterium]